MKTILSIAIISVVVVACSSDAVVSVNDTGSSDAHSKTDASTTGIQRFPASQVTYNFVPCGASAGVDITGEETAYIRTTRGGRQTDNVHEWRSTGAYNAYFKSIDSRYYPNGPEYNCPLIETVTFESYIDGPAGRCCYNYVDVIEFDENCNNTSYVRDGPNDCDGNLIIP